MPKDYSNGKIYQMEPICESDDGDIYIGSTTQNYISHRLAEHVRNYKCWKNGKKHFVSSFSLFEKYGIDNVRMILLESYPCNNNDELRAREAHYQKSMKCINKLVAFRSKEECQEQKKEYHKQYNQKNREERLEKSKIYYQNKKQELSEIMTCECGREIRKDSLKRHQRSDIHKELMTKIV